MPPPPPPHRTSREEDDVGEDGVEWEATSVAVPSATAAVSPSLPSALAWEDGGASNASGGGEGVGRSGTTEGVASRAPSPAEPAGAEPAGAEPRLHRCRRCLECLLGREWVEVLECRHSLCPRCMCEVLAEARNRGGPLRCPDPSCLGRDIDWHVYHAARDGGGVFGPVGDPVRHAVVEEGEPAAMSQSPVEAVATATAREAGTEKRNPARAPHAVAEERKPPARSPSPSPGGGAGDGRVPAAPREGGGSDDGGGGVVATASGAMPARRAGAAAPRAAEGWVSVYGDPVPAAVAEEEGVVAVYGDPAPAPAAAPSRRGGRRRRSAPSSSGGRPGRPTGARADRDGEGAAGASPTVSGGDTSGPRKKRAATAEDAAIRPRRSKRPGVWDIRFEELREYKAVHGDMDVPPDSKLKLWIKKQREEYARFQELGDLYRSARMTEERVRKLNGIGFNWRAKGRFEDRLKQLGEFKSQFGHCSPGVGRDTPREYHSLAAWVSGQRRQYKLWGEGKPSLLSEEKIRALEALGFQWNVKPQASAKRVAWDVRFQELCEFKATHGHMNAPPKSDLNLWMNRQRINYNKFIELGDRYQSQRMTEEKVRKLNSIGFNWCLIVRFEDRLKELEEFKRLFGHCSPGLGKDTPKEYHALAAWTSNQREHYKLWKEGKPTWLTAEKVRALDAVGFLWNVKEDRSEVWNRRFEELKQFKAEFGHCRVPHYYPVNKVLGRWVGQQRRDFKLHFVEGKSSAMTKERVDALNSIGFCWDNTIAWHKQKDRV